MCLGSARVLAPSSYIGAAVCSHMNILRSPKNMEMEGRQPWIKVYKYHILGAVYLLITGAALARVRRQPYPRRVKAEQYETIFKGTTLAAVVAGVTISGDLNKARSAEWRESYQAKLKADKEVNK